MRLRRAIFTDALFLSSAANSLLDGNKATVAAEKFCFAMALPFKERKCTGQTRAK